MPRHSDLVLSDGIHGAIAFEFATDAALLAASGFVAADKYKLGIALDTSTVYVLTDPVTPTWSILTNLSPPSVFGNDAQDTVSETTQSTNSTTFQVAHTLVVPVRNGRYRIGWGALLGVQSTGQRCEMRLWDATNSVQVGDLLVLEVKDINNRVFMHSFSYLDFVSQSRQLEIQWRKASGTAVSRIVNPKIEIWRVS